MNSISLRINFTKYTNQIWNYYFSIIESIWFNWVFFFLFQTTFDEISSDFFFFLYRVSIHWIHQRNYLSHHSSRHTHTYTCTHRMSKSKSNMEIILIDGRTLKMDWKKSSTIFFSYHFIKCYFFLLSVRREKVEKSLPLAV